MQRYSNHILNDNKYIDINSLVTTLHCLRILKYVENYDIINTQCKDYPLKDSIMSYYKNNGICNNPIIVTDDDFCLDGRHRVAYRKEINKTICSAYIVPRKYINKFIKKY